MSVLLAAAVVAYAPTPMPKEALVETHPLGASQQPAVELLHNTAAVELHEWPPKANVVKDLGVAAAASLAACQSACVAYLNTTVSPVSGWTRCASFIYLYESLPPRCAGVVDAYEWQPVLAVGATSGRLTWPPSSCATAADCSFNGVCNATTALCNCARAWRGDRCQTLALAPALPGAGLRVRDASGGNVSNWGGSVLLDTQASPPLYHMWASEIADGCGIETWRSNSRIVHATSTDGVHFARRSVVVDAFSHEPIVARAPTGEWVMWFTGEVEGAPSRPRCRECSGGNTPINTRCAAGFASVYGPSYLSWAASPFGPWSKPERLFASQAALTNMDTNLAATILPNGSVVGIGRTGGLPTGILAHLVTAGHWRDAASYVGRWQQMLFPDTKLVNFAGVEDPFVWRDPVLGAFHAVFHSQIENNDQRLCGGHAFSQDGERWTFTGTAWSNRVRFTTGAEYRFTRRERPSLLFDAQGAITALSTGVQLKGRKYVAGEDACYTLLQPVRR